MLTEILTKLFELFEQKYLLLEEESFIFWATEAGVLQWKTSQASRAVSVSLCFALELQV